MKHISEKEFSYLIFKTDSIKLSVLKCDYQTEGNPTINLVLQITSRASYQIYNFIIQIINSFISDI